MTLPWQLDTELYEQARLHQWEQDRRNQELLIEAMILEHPRIGGPRLPYGTTGVESDIWWAEYDRIMNEDLERKGGYGDDHD